jgi:ribosomal protein L2
MTASKHVFRFKATNNEDGRWGKEYNGATPQYRYRVLSYDYNKQEGFIAQEVHDYEYVNYPSILESSIVLLDYDDETQRLMQAGKYIKKGQTE